MDENENQSDYETYEDFLEDAVLDEEFMEKDRFMSTPDTTQVVHTPQCVSCIHNQGLKRCDAFGEKPTVYISNLKKCPKLSS